LETNYLKLLSRSMYDLQKMRIQLGNRLVKKGEKEEISTEEAAARMRFHFEEIEKAEKNFAKTIKKELKQYAVYNEFLSGIKGCGTVMSGVVISEIIVILRANVELKTM